MSRRREKDLKAKKKMKILAVPIVAAVAAAAAAGVILWQNAAEEPAQKTSGEAESQSPEGDVIWNGTAYDYNDHLSNYLFLGIDTREKAETSMGQADAGQADALYLLSWDRTTDDVSVITIPRDTITQIEVFGPSGESLGTTEDHVSLSYAYGDGSHES